MFIVFINKKTINLEKVIEFANSIKKSENNFKEHLDIIKTEMFKLLKKSQLAKDVTFLRKMAVNLKQLHYEAKKVKKFKLHHLLAQEVEHFLTTPLGAPFISRSTWIQAVDSFSIQNPTDSDLSLLLADFARYGAYYALQLLRIFQ